MNNTRLFTFLFSCILFMVVFLSACRKEAPSLPPTTCASSSSDSIGVGQSITFISCTKGDTSIVWNFGDSTFSKADTVTHYYYLPGTYTATLTSFNAGGKGTVKSFTVKVTAPDYWSINGHTYYASMVSLGLNGYVPAYNYVIGLFATSSINDVNLNNWSRFNIGFTGCGPGVVSATDTVLLGYIASPLNGAQLSLNYNGKSYISIPAGQTVNAAVAPDGNITVTGNNIKIAVPPALADTLSVSFHVTNRYHY